MSKSDVITYDSLPEAVQHLMKDVEEIKHMLLNQHTPPKSAIVDGVPEREILTVEEVANLLGIEKETVYNLNYKREIPHFKRGRRAYYDRKEIDAWMREDRRKTVKQLQEESETDFRSK